VLSFIRRTARLRGLLSDKTSPPRYTVSAAGAGAILIQLALFVAAFVTPAAADQEQATAPIILRVYNVYGLSESDLDTARMTVREVFKAAGVQTTWRNCPGTGADPCRERLKGNEIIVRLIRSPHDRPVSSAELTLGVSLVQSDLSRGSFTSVYPDRVGVIAPRFGREQDLLLGRAIAHELGHLLLGMTAHAPSGLMRARWSERPMQVTAPADWIFSEIEARQLRHAALARSTGPKPVDHIAAVNATAAVTTLAHIEH
jgi:hypothetical protein